MPMEFTTNYKERAEEIIALFTSTFTVSEGRDEGKLIGKLVTDMFATVNAKDIFVFSSLDGGSIIGAIIFTRLTYPLDERTVFVLGPVAVASDRQGQGIGQRLLQHGLQSLRESGVDIALTYGDIKFYSKRGFQHITESHAQAPLPLQYPEGWLGQSLTERPFDPLNGKPSCVAALNDPNYW